MFKRSAGRYDFYNFLTLVVLGYIFGCMCRLYFQNDTCLDDRDENIVNENNLLLVAIKSTRRSLIQYGDTIMKTWGCDIPGHVLFFLDNQPYTGTLPVINLPDVHNRSTSLEKTFSILKTVSATYSRNYEWLLIIEDQTFLHTERLERLLGTISSRGQNWYIGRLMKNESYCESETGILLSRHALNTISPHLNKCFLETQSTDDDDVVLGSCIKQYLDITCTGAVEFGEMFVNNNGGFFYPDKISSDTAIVIHPVLRPNSMYQWATYFQIQNATHQRIKLADLHDEIISMNSSLDEEKHDEFEIGGNEAEPEVGEYEDQNELGNENEEFDDSRMVDKFETRAEEDDYPYNFWTLIRYNLFLPIINAHNAAEKAVKAVIPHTNWVLSPTKYIRFAGGKTVQNIIIAKNGVERSIQSFHTYQNYTKPEVRFDDVDYTNTIWVILPLFKKVLAFRMFLNMFADAVAKFNGRVVLRVVLNIDGDGEWQKNHDYVKQMQERINLELIMSNAKFDRGTAKALGTNDLPKSSLLVFIDVDMYIDEGFLTRVRRNTIYNQQVYYPICFSQFDPKIICFQQQKCQINVKNFENRYGFWRDFGYGMVSMYKKDYLRIGGFDLTIKGWGDEDVNLNTKTLASGLRVFRAVDPSLVHIYHSKHCAKSLPFYRHNACLKSNTKHAGDVAELYKIVESIQNTETNELL